ncbi:DUF7065 domain-containing protein [Mycobacterium branderi]|uniref:DUF7065 domain-containing protein n=2 Tax=Mycobacterium branderi TaxID=43348 RepID=A0ABN6BHY4_9MYCO|nr:hypothetical protein [Mycobacterium branderi]MCV7234591.1 hypothetical protein [Mycobacterium branderi]BBZ15378.1 hypothetical protein MBRA_55730 [Mycobacterium branderi]
MLTSEVADYFNMNMGDDPYWSDSSWFSWAIPERNINGFFYTHFRPNMNCLLSGPAMWDPSGQHAWEFLYYDWQLMKPLPSGKYGIDYNKYDFEAPCTTSVRMLEPLKRYRLGYNRNNFKLDLVFEAVAAPHPVGERSEGGLEHAFRLHFEQPGHITGTVELDGETYRVDCYSIRDGSHGRRHLETVMTGGYTWSTADDKTGWHVLAVDKDNSRDTQVVAGYGYLLRDGHMAPITKGVRRVLERTGPRPSVVEVVAEDADGRTLHALGREQTPAEVILFPDHGQWWTLYKWDYDGFTDAVGEDQEYYSLDTFRRWHRAGPASWKTR